MNSIITLTHFRLQWRNFFTRCALLNNQKNISLDTANTRFQIQDISKSSIPIEKRSLSRGLVLNRFNKDFFIYPEYSDTDDVQNIQGFTEILRSTLEASINLHSVEKSATLPEPLKLALQNSAVFSLFIPKEFDGIGMSYKDQSRVFEELSIDWNIFVNVGINHSVSHLLLLFGSESQKQKYLPLIASGKCRPAVAFFEDYDDIARCEVVSNNNTTSVLNLSNIRVVGCNNANLIVIFVTSVHKLSKQKQFSCYIVDRTMMGEGEKWEYTRNETLGLKAFDIGRLNLSILIREENLLGAVGQGGEISGELMSSGRLPLAAATIGYGKRLLGELAFLCNRTSSNVSNTSRSGEPEVQRWTTELALKVYALESAVYYLSGLLDEKLPVVLDLENALIHRLTRDVLFSTITVSLELAGIQTSNTSLFYEKSIRDILTLLAMNTEGKTVQLIAMATLSSWAATSHKRVTSSLKRLFRQESINADMKNPKLTHYIAEHAHPSLQVACQELEHSMSRTNILISKMMVEQGKNLEQDYGSLEGLVKVLQNHLSMVAVISRSSRSYAVGLRNADIELAWATMICTRLSRENWFELEVLSDYFGLVKLNPSLLNIGRVVFDLGGYPIESPVERNW